MNSRNLSREKVIEYIELGINSRTYYLYAVCLVDKGFHIGNVKIGPFNRLNNTTDLVTIIGDKDYWGKGIGQTAIEIGTKLGFEEGKVRKFFGSVDSLNQGSLKAYKRAGWHIEAIARDFFQHEIKGKTLFSDRIFIGCNNHNFNNKKARNWHPINQLSNKKKGNNYLTSIKS